MKKILFILLVILAISFFCSAQLPLVRADETKTFIGTIESFRPAFARPPKWPIARFTAVADNGEKIEVYVLGRDTTVIDLDGKSTENKRPQVGKKVEIKYSTGEHEIYGGTRYEAISIRYVPADYVPQPAITTGQPNVAAQAVATANAYGEKIFVGKVESATLTFGTPPKWTFCRFTAVADNGEKKDIYVLRDATTITDVNGKPIWGTAPRVGRKIEVKYSTAENGHNEAISMRYVPSDYVQRETEPTAPEKTTPSATTNEANTFVGTIESFPHGPTHFKSGPPLWPFGMIVVAADNGEKNNFLIVGDGPNATTFYDTDGKSGTVGHIQVKIGQKVEVKYAITAMSMHYLNKALAISVRYVPLDSAQQQIAPTTPIQVTPGTTTQPENTFTGKVESFTKAMGKPPKWIYGILTVAADSGESMIIYVIKATAVTDASGNDMTEGGKKLGALLLKKGERVEVKYVTGTLMIKSRNEGISIRCLD